MKQSKIDKLLIGISLVVVLAIVSCLIAFPAAAENAASMLFHGITSAFGSVTLLFTFGGIVLLAGLCFSKYGKIKLGEGEPEFSTFKWVAMMMSCGLGAATCYWAFLEWAYYIDTPGLGLEAASRQAYEMAVPYTMFHWGFSAWTLYALVALPMCYHFYVRKNKGLSLSSVISSITGIKQNGVIGRIVDIIFIFICFGALSITLGVSVPLVTDVLCAVIGIQSESWMNIVIILLISAIYSFSSYIGLKKGMSKLADTNIKLVILFTVGILVLGPTFFLIDNTTQSFGLMLQNFIQMSTFTDAIGKSGFPQSWTIFYWFYWITYAPFTGIFIAKVSKGRTIRSVIINTIISGSAGCFLYFGILGSYSLHQQISGAVDMVGMLAGGQDTAAIIEVLKSLPFGSVFMLLFCINSLLFLATSINGAAMTMATTSTIGLRSDEEPNPFLRLFWCVLLAIVPLTMILIHASLSTIKTCAIVTAAPLLFIIAIMVWGWMKWMVKDMKKSSET